VKFYIFKTFKIVGDSVGDVKNGHKKKALKKFQNPCQLLEATSGFEPENNGFAGHCLTTWPSRLKNDGAGNEI
jgi:hypothetical protein